MIVDASVAIKWLVNEEGSELADKLLLQGELIAPDLIAAEISNAVWKKWGRGELLGVPPGLDGVLQAFDALESGQGLAHRAAEIAIELNHPVYDCFYLALAEATGQKIVTEDRHLIGKLERTAFRTMVQTLVEATAR